MKGCQLFQFIEDLVEISWKCCIDVYSLPPNKSLMWVLKGRERGGEREVESEREGGGGK